MTTTKQSSSRTAEDKRDHQYLHEQHISSVRLCDCQLIFSWQIDETESPI